MPDQLFTIGHSTHFTGDFVGMLKQKSIEVVCDVRSHPYSKYNPQYNKETIAGELKDNNIRYIFLGKELGARNDNPDCYANDKVQFQKLIHEPLFQQGLDRLRQGMRKYSIALMCAEKDPLTCHRTILVTRQLRREVVVSHILADGGIESNAEAEKRLMNMLNIHPDLARNENQCIEEAYDLQGQKIAYVKETA